MKIKFESRFEKDLRKIKDQKVLSELKQIIIQCKTIKNLSEINRFKKLQGYDTFYRIRLGNYRIGIELIDNTIIFTRFLHRKDIYKFFP
jgi:mRNA interferase RelE/StbE